jgi:hypothetical protein
MTTTDEESVNSFDAEEATYITFIMGSSKSSGATLTETTSTPPSQHESEKDQNRRRQKAYESYRHHAKPTKASMYSIVDYYANKIDITRQDVDLLPWNLEKTEVSKEAMKSTKKEYTQKAEKKDKKTEKKVKALSGREDAAFAKSNDCNECPTLPKGKIDDSSTSLDSGSLDTSSSSLDQDHTQDDRVSVEQLQASKVEEEHNRKKEERRRKKEEAKKSMPEVDVQDKSTEEETRRNIEETRRDDRLERAFLWYTRMASPSRKEFKRQIATQESIDITPEDVDLLPWNETGSRVMNIATMDAMIRARMLKESATKVPAPRRRC